MFRRNMKRRGITALKRAVRPERAGGNPVLDELQYWSG